MNKFTLYILKFFIFSGCFFLNPVKAKEAFLRVYCVNNLRFMDENSKLIEEDFFESTREFFDDDYKSQKDSFEGSDFFNQIFYIKFKTPKKQKIENMFRIYPYIDAYKNNFNENFYVITDASLERIINDQKAFEIKNFKFSNNKISIGRELLDLEKLEYREEKNFFNLYGYKRHFEIGDCMELDDSYPPIEGINLSKVANAIYMGGGVNNEKNIKKTLEIYNAAIKEFDDWEDEIYPTLMTYSESQIDAHFQRASIMMHGLSRGFKDPIFNSKVVLNDSDFVIRESDKEKLPTHTYFLRAKAGFYENMKNAPQNATPEYAVNTTLLNQVVDDIDNYLNKWGERTWRKHHPEAYYIKGVSLVFTGYNKEGCISLKKSKELNHIQANYWFNKWCN